MASRTGISSRLRPITYGARPSDKVMDVVSELRPFLWQTVTSAPPYRRYYLYLSPTGEQRYPQWLSIYAIPRARVRVRSGMHEAATTKTGKSRVVDLDPVTVAALKRWKAVQNEERLAWGAAYQPSGLVFTKEDGSGLHADHVQQRFGRLIAQAGMPTIRYHDLRHTHASLLLAAGTPVLDVSKRIGHASAAMTLNVYGHVVPGQGQKAAATFAALVDGAR